MYFFLDCELFVVHIPDLNVTFDYSVNFSSTGSFTYADVRTAKLLRISIEDAIPIFDFPLIRGKNHWYKTIYFIRHVIITHIVVVDKSVMVTNLQRQLVTATKFYNNRKDAEWGNISFLRHRSCCLFRFFLSHIFLLLFILCHANASGNTKITSSVN